MAELPRSKLPVVPPGGNLTGRASQQVSGTGAAGALARQAHGPLNQAEHMALQDGMLLRDACWASLSERLRARLLELSGATIEWWAATESADGHSRAHAVVLGDRGLSFGDPRLNNEHRPVYAVASYILDPASFRSVSIDHRPPAGVRSAGGQGTGSPAQKLTATRQPEVAGLSHGARGLLGNLPPQAQQLLQAPFLEGQGVLRCNWYYEGSDNHLSMFMVFLAGPHDVTSATGTRLIPTGHTENTAHWSLTCRRASVVRRIGQ